MASHGQQSHSLPPGSPPTAPPGWKSTWSSQHEAWYWVDIATGFSQWDYPSGPPQDTHSNQTPQPNPQNPDQSQQLQQNHTANHGDPSSDRGIGSAAAGMFLGYQLHGHSKPNNNNNIFDSMATYVGSTGVGALGAKFFGGSQQPNPSQNTHSASYQPPYPSYASSPSPPAPYYPTHQPASGSGHYGVGAGMATGGAVAAGMHAASNYPHHYQQQSPANPPNVGAGAGVGGHASSRTGLNVHAAVFADKDVTARVRTLITADQQLPIKKKMTEDFGDPWPETDRKGLNILYQYGDRPMEMYAGSTADEATVIKNAALSNERMAFINKKPGRIVCLIWGQESVLSDARIEKLEKDGELDCKDLDRGGWWAWEQRTLVCYYRGQHGNIEVASAREGGTLRLPWNPLAKWS